MLQEGHAQLKPAMGRWAGPPPRAARPAQAATAAASGTAKKPPRKNIADLVGPERDYGRVPIRIKASAACTEKKGAGEKKRKREHG
eukprot:2565770-Pyramimonas_sp.AAC.1